MYTYFVYTGHPTSFGKILWRPEVESSLFLLPKITDLHGSVSTVSRPLTHDSVPLQPRHLASRVKGSTATSRLTLCHKDTFVPLFCFEHMAQQIHSFDRLYLELRT
jgi:hypothetical protein